MIRAVADLKDGGRAVIVVLDPLNLALFRNGKPVDIDLSKLLPDVQNTKLVLMYSADEQEMAKDVMTQFNIAKVEQQRGH